MIFGEPTNNEILVGSKGLLEFELNFKGIKAHSSNPEKGKSANINALKFLLDLEAFYKEHLEESIIKQLSKQENISLDEAMNLYYNSKLANYIHEGKYDIQYLDYKVLTDNLIKELQNQYSSC